MLTLNDIDGMFPETHDGSVYSDLYKACYGNRPRYVTFENLEDFQQDFDHLANEVLPHVMEREEQAKKDAIIKFEKLVELHKSLVVNATYADIIRHIADANGNDFKMTLAYDYNDLEYDFGLPFGYIKAHIS